MPDSCFRVEDQRDAIPVELGLRLMAVRVLSHVGLTVSKIARLADPDEEGIRDVVAARLTGTDEIEARAMEALGGYVGNVSALRLDIRDASAIARHAERERSPENSR